MAFLQEFRPHMVGIGPFLPHHATPFRDEPAGGLQDTLFCVALTRLALPEALIPATTALATLEVSGRDAALLGGRKRDYAQPLPRRRAEKIPSL